MNHPYLKDIRNCSTSYKFSNGTNYFRELETTASLFFMHIHHANSKKGEKHTNAQKHYDTMLGYLNVILKSKNKTAKSGKD